VGEFKLSSDILIGTLPLTESTQTLAAPQYNTVVTNQPPLAPSITEQTDNYDSGMTYLLTYFLTFCFARHFASVAG